MSLIAHPGFYVTFALLQAVGLIVAVRLIDHYDREPLPSVVLAAAWGATGAAFLSLLGNRAIDGMLSPQTKLVFGGAISAPIVEEAAKGIALVAIVVLSRWAHTRLGTPTFEGVTDGLLYGVAVGLGFAFTEDFFFFLNRASAEGLDSGFQLFLARRDFFGPQSLHHPLFTAPFGVALGLATWARTRRWRVALPLLGLLGAMLIHAVNNGLVEAILTGRYGVDVTAAYLEGQPVDAVVLDTASGVLQVLQVVDYSYLVLAAIGILAWQRYQRRVIFVQLRAEASSGLISTSDRETVVRWSRRLRTYWYLLRKRDFIGWRRLRSYHHEVAKLGLTKWRVRRFGLDPKQVRAARRKLTALRAASLSPASVPWSTSTLVGRGHDLDAITGLVQDDVRLITLTGVDGVGKRALALEIASRFADVKPGGSHAVAAETAAGLAPALARALSITPMPAMPLAARLAATVLRQPTLIAVEVRERPRDDAALAAAVAELLAAAPALQIIVSTTEPLGLAGERVHRVAPLSIPEVAATGSRRRRRQRVNLEDSDAVALFLLRAIDAKRTFMLDASTSTDVAAICAELRGSPLAIELVAPWVRFLEPAEILTGVRAVMASRDDADVVRVALDWSYGMLDGEQQSMFERLSLFRGGCESDAIETVCPSGPRSEWDEVETAISLVERGLLRQHAQPGNRPRFEMAPVVRAYASARRGERRSHRVLERSFVRYHRRLVDEVDREHHHAGHVHEWKRRLDQEHDNLALATRLAVVHNTPHEALAIAAAMGWYWEAGLLADGRGWVEGAMRETAGRPVHERLVARASEAAGRLALLEGDVTGAATRFSTAAAGLRERRDAPLLLRSLLGFGWSLAIGGDYQAAAARFEEATMIARSLTDDAGLAAAFTGLGRALGEYGRTDRAHELLERARKLRRFLDDDAAEADALAHLGRLAVLEGRYDQAVLHLEESLAKSQQLGDRLGAGDPTLDTTTLLAADIEGELIPVSFELGARLLAGEAMQTFALAALEQAEYGSALRLLRDRIALCDRIGNRLGLVEALEAFAVTVAPYDAVLAARLLAFVVESRVQLRVRGWLADRERVQRATERVRHALGTTAFDDASLYGKTLTTDEAVLEASGSVLELLDAMASPPRVLPSDAERLVGAADR